MTEIQVRDRRLPGHYWGDNEVVDVHLKRIGYHGLAVYTVLCRYARNGTGECRIANRELAEILQMSVGRLRKSIADLHNAGLLTVVIPAKLSPHNPASYTLLAVPKASRVVTHDRGKTVSSQDTVTVSPDDTVSPSDTVTVSPGDTNCVTRRHGTVSPGDTPNKEAILNTNKTKATPLAAKAAVRKPDPFRGLEEQIQEIYNLGRKVKRFYALKAIRAAALKIQDRFGSLAEALAWLGERYAQFSSSPAGQQGKTTPYCSSWFNAEQYDDDVGEWYRTAANGKPKLKPLKEFYEQLEESEEQERADSAAASGT